MPAQVAAAALATPLQRNCTKQSSQVGCHADIVTLHINVQEHACSLRKDSKQLEEQQQAVPSWPLGECQPGNADDNVDRAQVEILRKSTATSVKRITFI